MTHIISLGLRVILVCINSNVNQYYRPDNISWRFCLHQRAPTYLLSILTPFRWMGALLHVSIREGTHLKSLPI